MRKQVKKLDDLIIKNQTQDYTNRCTVQKLYTAAPNVDIYLWNRVDIQ